VPTDDRVALNDLPEDSQSSNSTKPAQSLLKCSVRPPRPRRQRNERRLSLSERIGFNRTDSSQLCLKEQRTLHPRSAGDLAHLAGLFALGILRGRGIRIATNIADSKGKNMAAIAQPTFQTSTTADSKVHQRRGYGYWAPTAKVSAGVLAGAITILLTALLGPHWRHWTQQEMTPGVGAAIANILTFAIQYWVPDRRR
jgi:hypothetical protein